MGLRSVAFVRREFELGGVVDQYTDLYRHILGERFQAARTPSAVDEARALCRLGGEPG
jgi:hypothetical protein